VRPAEKAFRPSHRASIHGAIIHDASYYTFVEVVGPELLLKSMLDQICDPAKAGAGSARYVYRVHVRSKHSRILDI
jgi:ribonuclease P/MRP protein subunit POP1